MSARPYRVTERVRLTDGATGKIVARAGNTFKTVRYNIALDAGGNRHVRFEEIVGHVDDAAPQGGATPAGELAAEFAQIAADKSRFWDELRRANAKNEGKSVPDLAEIRRLFAAMRDLDRRVDELRTAHFPDAGTLAVQSDETFGQPAIAWTCDQHGENYREVWTAQSGLAVAEPPAGPAGSVDPVGYFVTPWGATAVASPDAAVAYFDTLEEAQAEVDHDRDIPRIYSRMQIFAISLVEDIDLGPSPLSEYEKAKRAAAAADEIAAADSAPAAVDPDDPTAMALPAIGDRVLLHDGLKADVISRVQPYASKRWGVATETGQRRTVGLDEIAGYPQDEHPFVRTSDSDRLGLVTSEHDGLIWVSLQDNLVRTGWRPANGHEPADVTPLDLPAALHEYHQAVPQ